MAKQNLRIIKRRNGRQWIECKMKELKPGDQIRIWEPDGTRLKNGDKYVFTVEDAPTFNGYGARVWGITVK